jgi:hypothetical protein
VVVSPQRTHVQCNKNSDDSPAWFSSSLRYLSQPTDGRANGSGGWRPVGFDKALVSKGGLRKMGQPSTTASTLTYETVQAPPATVFLHALHCQIPTECLFTVVLPQKLHAARILANVQCSKSLWALTVFGVLRDFHLLDLLSQRGTVTRTE